jgi:hypothetical protein
LVTSTRTECPGRNTLAVPSMSTLKVSAELRIWHQTIRHQLTNKCLIEHLSDRCTDQILATRAKLSSVARAKPQISKLGRGAIWGLRACKLQRTIPSQMLYASPVGCTSTSLTIQSMEAAVVPTRRLMVTGPAMARASASGGEV